MNKKRLFIVIILFSVLPSINTLWNGYSLDDDFVTEINNTTKGFSSFKEIFTTHYIENKGGFSYEYRPIVKLSFAIEHHLFGVKPGFSHAINVILYALLCILLFKFLDAIFETKYRNTVFLSVLIFSVLPIHSEVIASLKNRDILLSGIFGLLAGILIFKKNKILFHYLLISICLFLSFGSKQDALGFVLVILLIMLLAKNKWTVKEKSLSAFFLIIGYLLFSILKKVLLTSQNSRTISFYENPLVESGSFSEVLNTAFFTVGFYSKQILFPYKMSCYYGYDFTNFSSVQNPLTLIGIAVSLIILLIFIKYKFSQNIILVSAIFIVIFFGMYSNIVVKVPGVVADRFAFFPSIGFSLLIAYCILKNNDLNYFSIDQLQKYKTPSIIILTVFVFLSLSRNSEWKNRLTLFSSDVSKYPKSYKLITMLATEQVQKANDMKQNLSQQEMQNMIMNSFQNFKKAHLIYQKDYETLNNLGFFEMNYTRNYSLALSYFKASLNENNQFPDVYFNIGIANKKLNLIDSSQHYFEMCIDRFPTFENAYKYLSEIYFTTHNSQALEHLILKEKQYVLSKEMIQNHEEMLRKLQN
jgi:tetratricopeptide (TPR) repeat protein